MCLFFCDVLFIRSVFGMIIIRDEFENRVAVQGEIPDAISFVVSDQLRTDEEKLGWYKFTVAYMGKFPDDLSDEGKWPYVPEGTDRQKAGEVFDDHDIRNQYAFEVVDKWLNADWMDRSIEKLKRSVDQGRFSRIKIVAPQTQNQNSSSNLITSMMLNALLVRIVLLNRDVDDRVIGNLGPKLAGIPVRVTNPYDDLHVAIKGRRGTIRSSSDGADFSIKEKYIGDKLGRQIVVDGDVDEDSLYWLIDDGITYGTTMRAYADHIISFGGTVGAISTLTKRFMGCEIIEPRDSSYQFLKKVAENQLANDDGNSKKMNGLNETEFTLDIATSMIGFSLGLEDFSKATATNQEMLAVGACLMDPHNNVHRDLFNAALRDIGTSIEDCPDSYIVKLSSLEAGNADEFEELLFYGSEQRTMWSRPSYLSHDTLTFPPVLRPTE